MAGRQGRLPAGERTQLKLSVDAATRSAINSFARTEGLSISAATVRLIRRGLSGPAPGFATAVSTLRTISSHSERATVAALLIADERTRTVALRQARYLAPAELADSVDAMWRGGTRVEEVRLYLSREGGMPDRDEQDEYLGVWADRVAELRDTSGRDHSSLIAQKRFAGSFGPHIPA